MKARDRFSREILRGHLKDAYGRTIKLPYVDDINIVSKIWHGKGIKQMMIEGQLVYKYNKGNLIYSRLDEKHTI